MSQDEQQCPVCGWIDVPNFYTDHLSDITTAYCCNCGAEIPAVVKPNTDYITAPCEIAGLANLDIFLKRVKDTITNSKRDSVVKIECIMIPPEFVNFKLTSELESRAMSPEQFNALFWNGEVTVSPKTSLD